MSNSKWSGIVGIETPVQTFYGECDGHRPEMVLVKVIAKL